MSKVRVYDLSKELSLENKDILAICGQIGVAVKSHSSSIEEAEAISIRTAARNYQPSAHPPSTSSAPPPSRNTAPLDKPKKQQILQVRRSPEGVATSPTRPDQLVAPPVAPKGAGVTPPAATAEPRPMPPMAKKPAIEPHVAVAPTAAAPIAPAPIAPTAAKPEMAAKPEVTAKPEVPVRSTVARPVNPPPRPVLNKPPSIVKKAAPRSDVPVEGGVPRPGPAKPGPSKLAPGQKPAARPQQIVELRRR
jgi:translation initiation factor IF-2